MILIFHAQAARNIRDQNCQVTALFFTSNWETLRYGLFRTMTHQIRRMQAAEPLEVILDGYHRRFRWYSGMPYWVDRNDEYDAHPNGYIRQFHVSGAWYWIDGDGQRVWDTIGLGF